MTYELSAKALKVTLVLDPQEVAALPDPPTARVVLKVRAGSQVVRADIPSKGLRKAKATILEHGDDSSPVILQGKLEAGGIIVEAGLAVPLRPPKAAPITARI